MDEIVEQAPPPPGEATLSERAALLDEWVAGERSLARLHAHQAVLLARRLDLLAEEPDFDAGGDVSLRSLAAEYGAAAHIPPSTAAVRLTDAWALVHHHPAVLASLQAGRITRQHADVILNEAPAVSAGDAEGERIRAEYERRVLAFAEQDTAARTRAHARGVVAALMPEETVTEHKRGRARRQVTVAPAGDGMAVLSALLPELLAYAIRDRLTGQARALRKQAEAERIAARSIPEPPDLPEDSDFAAQAFLDGLDDVEETTSVTPPEQGLWADAPGTSLPAPWESPSPAPAGRSSAEAQHRLAIEDRLVFDDRLTDLQDRLVDLEDLSPFSAAASAFMCGLPDPADERPPAEPMRIVADADVPPVDAEFDAIVAAFHASGPPEDPSPPEPDRRRVPHSPPDLPSGVLADDERTMDQLRADLLCDLLLTAAPTSAGESALGSIRARVQVTVRASTLAGADDLPAEFDGVGPLDPDEARTLAGLAPSLDRLFLDARGMVTATDSYTPTANMKRFLRARDQHCRFPGCRRPPHECQVDHNEDHARGGATALSNLALFCTGHHPIKHPDLFDEDRWTARQRPGGVIEWTSPLGRTYTDAPAPRVMFV